MQYVYSVLYSTTRTTDSEVSIIGQTSVDIVIVSDQLFHSKAGFCKTTGLNSKELNELFYPDESFIFPITVITIKN